MVRKDSEKDTSPFGDKEMDYSKWDGFGEEEEEEGVRPVPRVTRLDTASRITIGGGGWSAAPVPAPAPARAGSWANNESRYFRTRAGENVRNMERNIFDRLEVRSAVFSVGLGGKVATVVRSPKPRAAIDYSKWDVGFCGVLSPRKPRVVRSVWFRVVNS